MIHSTHPGRALVIVASVGACLSLLLPQASAQPTSSPPDEPVYDEPYDTPAPPPAPPEPRRAPEGQEPATGTPPAGHHPPSPPDGYRRHDRRHLPPRGQAVPRHVPPGYPPPGYPPPEGYYPPPGYPPPGYPPPEGYYPPPGYPPPGYPPPEGYPLPYDYGYGLPPAPPPVPKERRSVPMMVSGIVLSAAGGVAALAGVMLMEAARESGCRYAGDVWCEDDLGKRDTGIALTVVGLAAVGAGIPLAIVGATKVRVKDDKTETDATLRLLVTPTRLSLEGSL